jgi:integrase
MALVLQRMGRNETAHGFRSSFRVWAAEQTNYPREVAEQALAHTISDKVEAAYKRTTLFDKRRTLMAQWAKFCTTPSKAASADVVPIGGAR